MIASGSNNDCAAVQLESGAARDVDSWLKRSHTRNEFSSQARGKVTREAGNTMRHFFSSKPSSWRKEKKTVNAKQKRECQERFTKDLRPLSAVYRIGNLLGKGVSGTVSECTHKESGITFACKSISKASFYLNDNAAEELHREVTVDFVTIWELRAIVKVFFYKTHL